jgi:SAM-dependent methyltransferase
MWRFPTNWPYPEDFYSTNTTASASEYWTAAAAAAAESSPSNSNNKPVGPFTVGKELEAMHAHLTRHVPAGSRILDLGAGEQSPLPTSLNPQEVVGVGASEAEMEPNPSLAQKVVLDLNAGEAFRLPFEDGSFDAVVCANTIEYLTDPRPVFR